MGMNINNTGTGVGNKQAARAKREGRADILQLRVV